MFNLMGLMRKSELLYCHIVNNENSEEFYYEFKSFERSFPSVYRGIAGSIIKFKNSQPFSTGMAFSSDFEVAERFAYDNINLIDAIEPIVFRFTNAVGISIEEVIESTIEDAEELYLHSKYTKDFELEEELEIILEHLYKCSEYAECEQEILVNNFVASGVITESERMRMSNCYIIDLITD